MPLWIPLAAVLALGNLVGPSPVPPEEVVISAPSPYEFEDTIARVKASLRGHNLRVLREREIEAGNDRHRDIYFCDFAMLQEAVTADRRIGYALPCRITVSARAGGVQIASVAPAAASRASGLDTGGLCSRLQATIGEVIDEATL